MSQITGIPDGFYCMVADKNETYSTVQCPMLQREMGGSGSVGCEGVIVCPMRVYRCSIHTEYELAVKKTPGNTMVIKCAECTFDTENKESDGGNNHAE